MKFSLILKLKPLVRDFWSFAPQKITLAMILMLLSSITSSIGIIFIIPLLESINIDLGSDASSDISNKINSLFVFLGIQLDLPMVLSIYLFVIIVKALINFADSIVATSLQARFIVDMKKRLYRQLFYAKWQFLNQEHMADFIRLVTGQVDMVGYSLQQVLTLFSNLILIFVYLLLAIWLSPSLTILALMMALVLIVIMLPVNALIHRSGTRELFASTNMFRNIFEHVSNIKIIKSFAAEQQCLEKAHSTNVLLEKQQVKITFYSALTRCINLVGAATIFTLLFYFAIQVLALPIANLLIILFIFSRLMPQISGLQNTLMQLIHQAPDYIDLLEKSDQLAKHSEKIDSEVKAPEFNQYIEFKDLGYCYPGKQKPALENLNITINKNQSIAITGYSGAGKSTLADIIAGLNSPTSGAMLIDGTKIDSKNQYKWRSKVAYVTQDIYLFHDTVQNNLNWIFDKQLDDKALWHALTQAAADEFVKNLPDGLNTLIGDKGVKLSGGERQRIALARALLSKPEILILDEATSALDRQNELKIRDALINLDGQLTIFVIAHNETTIEHIPHRINLD